MKNVLDQLKNILPEQFNKAVNKYKSAIKVIRDRDIRTPMPKLCNWNRDETEMFDKYNSMCGGGGGNGGHSGMW